MGHSSPRRRSLRRKATFEGFGGDTAGAPYPTLVLATDAFLWLTLIAVTINFGGRSALGQLVFVIGASLAAGCWCLHQLTSKHPCYRHTNSLWLWLAGCLISLIQIVPLTGKWIQFLSPKIASILPLWFDQGGHSLFPGGWAQLSLAPWETTSGLATFMAYALLFLVMTQRLESLADAETVIRGVALVAVGMAAFGIAQYYFGNGKFFWFYQHPYRDTDLYVVGSFTNRNHTAQFLALGVGPMIWWLMDHVRRRNETPSGVNFPRANTEAIKLGTIVMGIGMLLLGVLLTLSRGGTLAMGLAIVVTLVGLSRVGAISTRMVMGLTLGAFVAGGVLYATRFQAIEHRIENGEIKMRLEIWAANIAVARDFPVFGTGVGTHVNAHRLHLDRYESNGEFTHAESGFLQVASETGLVGFGLALLFVAVAARWCLRAMRHPKQEVAASAAVVFGSLCANTVHAWFDFFWYTPGCMLMLMMQLAAVQRLSALTSEAEGRASRTLALPRVSPVVGFGTIAAVGIWMGSLKYPDAVAEPHRMEYLNLVHHSTPVGSDEVGDVLKDKLQAGLSAARLAPHNAEFQADAAHLCLLWFEHLQEQGDNSMSLALIDDAVKSSQFESAAALRDWLDLAIGSHVKYLRLSRKYARRALADSPLEATAYLRLAEVACIDRPQPGLERKLLMQTLALRPHDAEALFAIGRHLFIEGDVDAAFLHLQNAFHRGGRYRLSVAQLLVRLVPAQFILDKFSPDWDELDLLARVFLAAGRIEDASILRQEYIKESERRIAAGHDAEVTYLGLRHAWHELEEPDRAIQVLQLAVKALPYSLAIRRSLAYDLYREGRYADAAQHLKWCADRNPEDTQLHKMASHAMKEHLKSSHQHGMMSVDRNQEPMALR